MISENVRKLADAVMREGACLYPYRRSSLKNRGYVSLAALPPRDASSDGAMREGLTAACLLKGEAGAQVQVLLRFVVDAGAEPCSHEIRSVCSAGVARSAFSFGAVSGALVLERTSLGAGHERLRASVRNCSELGGEQLASRENAHRRSLHGVHLLWHSERAAHFVSLTDPAPESAPYARLCEGRGLWCTVLGSDRARPDTALSAPMILPDFPQVAPESCTDLCDATEIDELLALRIRCLADSERREARAGAGYVRTLLDRVEALTEEELLRLHGGRRDQHDVNADAVHTGTARGLRGARVRLAPCPGADAMDLLLAGREAVVCDVERTVDGRILLAVTLVDDPGRDLGAQGMPGHRFFFGVEEVTLIEADARTVP